jgi:hypothetical protein
MSTENTQTDVPASDVGAASTDINSGVETVTSASSASATEKMSLDGLKKLSKDADASFTAKPVSEAMEEAVAPVVPVNAYTPNFKYKAALQEKEVEEFWRPLIKDADSEKRVKSALEKLDGFDFVKDSREKIQKDYETLSGDYAHQTKLVERVVGAVNKKDFTSVFRQLGIADQDLFQHVQQKLQLMELPPEQRRVYEEADAARTQQEQLNEQMTQYKDMYAEQARQTRGMQLDFILSRPEVKSAVESWDNLQGSQGAFRDLVIQEAKMAWYDSEQDLSAEQAVQLVMQKYGNAFKGGVAEAPQAHSHSSQTPIIAAPQAKPVIPSINGKGTAPIKKVPKSLEDLKRMGKEAASQGL